MSEKLKAVGWIAYCVKLKKGTAVHRGPWRGWLEPTKAKMAAFIKQHKSDVSYATLVPTRLYAVVPPKPKPKPRCPTCHREVRHGQGKG